MIDLHSHTSASDGQHSPDELVALAAAAGVTTLSVTDHDTVAGIERSRQAAQARGLRLVPGIELSAFVARREVHILGHFIDPSNPRLASFSQRLRAERRRRMEQMVERMQRLGFPVSMREVEALAGDAQLGRPHLARVLVERHWVVDTQEAFDRFLGDGKPAHVDRFRLEGVEAIELIHGAGGTATLAHPAVSRVDRVQLAALKQAGLDGVEVQHSDQDLATQQRYLAFARELDLVPTAGSDFHGEKVAPHRHLGTASMDPAAFAVLERRAAELSVSAPRP